MSANDKRDFVMPAADAFASGSDDYRGTRFERGASTAETLALVEEAPLALSYNDRPHAVMLLTPTDLEDFAVGFSLSEGILDAASEVESLDIVPSREGIAALMRIPAARAGRLEDIRRNVGGHGGCGLCGIENLHAAMRPPRVLPRRIAVTPAAISGAVALLGGRQVVGERTGAAHAAAFASVDGNVVAVREDAGRHNALDKLIGHLGRAGIDPGTGFLVMTSRGSSELAMKACFAGFELMATISAPTGLAVRIAEAAGMTLIGFARDGRFTCYAEASRIRS